MEDIDEIRILARFHLQLLGITTKRKASLILGKFQRENKINIYLFWVL